MLLLYYFLIWSIIYQMKIDQDKVMAIVNSDPINLRRLLSFTPDMPLRTILDKYLIFRSVFFGEYFKYPQTAEHQKAISRFISLYIGDIKSYMLLAYRGFSKTTDLKILVVFFLCCDLTQHRKYFKFISIDEVNATDFVVDVYNFLHMNKIKRYFNVFGREISDEDDDIKLEETKKAFITNTKVKILSSTAGKNQRGNVKMVYRPDFLILDDIENKITVESVKETNNVWGAVTEAITGLASSGVYAVLGNYISAKRNIQKLVKKSRKSPNIHKLDIVSIRRPDGSPHWTGHPDYTREKIDQIERDNPEVFDGEFLCQPNDLDNSYFAKYIKSEAFKNHPIIKPINRNEKYQIFKKPIPKHRYVVGVDPAGGNGGDYAVIVIIDYTNQLDREVVLLYRDRYTDPEELGKLAIELAKKYNNGYIIHENNVFQQSAGGGEIVTQVIKKANYPNYHKTITYNKETETESEKMGFNTNKSTKPIILSWLNESLKYNNLRVNSQIILDQIQDFPREYAGDVKIEDNENGHFDILMAVAIANEGCKHAFSVGDVKVVFSDEFSTPDIQNIKQLIVLDI